MISSGAFSPAASSKHHGHSCCSLEDRSVLPTAPMSASDTGMQTWAVKKRHQTQQLRIYPEGIYWPIDWCGHAKTPRFSITTLLQSQPIYIGNSKHQSLPTTSGKPPITLCMPGGTMSSLGFRTICTTRDSFSKDPGLPTIPNLFSGLWRTQLPRML